MDTMETCPNCGARVSPGLDWCGQCQARLPRPEAERVPLDLVLRGRLPKSEPAAKPVFSRTKAGATSFGAVGRAIMTLLLLIAVPIGYPMTRGMAVAFVGLDIPGRGFMIYYFIFVSPFVAYVLYRIWRRARVA